MNKKTPDPIDRHVGARLRARRMGLGFSQEKLGAALGVTFQQVQKYEKGSNRIGASRLQLAARILEVPVNYFFDGASVENGAVRGTNHSAKANTTSVIASEPSEATLLTAFARVRDPQLRLRIIELVEAMAHKSTS